MPIEFRIEPRESVVYARFEGDITVDDLRSYNEKLRQDPNFHSELCELVEVGEIDPKLEYGRLAAYTQWFVSLPPIKCTAIVAATPLAYGMARSFSTLAESGQATVQVFRDGEYARAWIGHMNRKPAGE